MRNLTRATRLRCHGGCSRGMTHLIHRSFGATIVEPSSWGADIIGVRAVV